MAGRPAKPTALLVASGTFRPHRHARRLDAQAAMPGPLKPKWVKGDAAKLWERIVALAPSGMLWRLDSTLLAGTCSWYGLWLKYNRLLYQTEGDTYKLSIQATTAWKNYMAGLTKLGLSPTDRARLQIAADDLRESDEPQHLSQLVG